MRTLISDPIANKYAVALFNTAKKKGINDEVLSFLREVNKEYNKNEEFHSVLINPEISEENKISILHEIIKGNKNEKFLLKFFEILVEKDRMKIYPHILEKYISINKSHKGILDVFLTSPYKISKKRKKEIGEVINENFEDYKKINIEVDIDKDLIGGIMLEMGGKIYDGSIKGYLNNLKKVLRGE